MGSFGMGRDVHSLTLSIQHFSCQARRGPPPIQVAVQDGFGGAVVTCYIPEPCCFIFSVLPLARCGLAVRRLAGKQKDLGSIRFGSPFSFLQKLFLWTLPCDFAHTINETLK